MRCLIRPAVVWLLMGLPVTLLADRRSLNGDSDGSAAAEVSPTPAHLHKHHHSKRSPTPADEATGSPMPERGDDQSLTQRRKDAEGEDGGEDSGGADVSPTPDSFSAYLHKHRHSKAMASPEDEATGSPAPERRHETEAGDADSGVDATPALRKRHHVDADSDDSATADVSPSPAHIHKHRHSTGSPTASPEDEATGSPAPERRHETEAGDADSGVDATPALRKRHHVDADSGDTGDQTLTQRRGGAEGEGGGGDSAAAGTSPSADFATPKPRPSMAPNASLDTHELEDFPKQPDKVQAVIEAALALTRQNLTYTSGSADPANGGMDCSGFVYYVLTQAGYSDVPRDASGQYSWVRKADNFRAVISRRLDGFELDELKPGDLLFWSGTYKTEHDPPVTHTMIYLGREKATGNRVMVGSSDGRSYNGLGRWGVSVFDFRPTAASSPAPGGNSPQFIGYGAAPGM